MKGYQERAGTSMKSTMIKIVSLLLLILLCVLSSGCRSQATNKSLLLEEVAIEESIISAEDIRKLDPKFQGSVELTLEPGFSIHDSIKEIIIGADNTRQVLGTSSPSPENAVGRILITTPTGSGSICTGTLVRENVIVSAGHCFWDNPRGSNAVFQHYFHVQGRQFSIPITNVRHGAKSSPNGIGDWAVAILAQRPGPPNTQPFSTIKFEPSPADILFSTRLVGYPGDIQNGNVPVRSRGCRASELNAGRVGPYPLLLKHECDTSGGMSGSATLIDGQTTALGVHTGGQGSNGCQYSNSCYNVAVNTAVFFNVLKDAVADGKFD